MFEGFNTELIQVLDQSAGFVLRSSLRCNPAPDLPTTTGRIPVRHPRVYFFISLNVIFSFHLHTRLHRQLNIREHERIVRSISQMLCTLNSMVCRSSTFTYVHLPPTLNQRVGGSSPPRLTSFSLEI